MGFRVLVVCEQARPWLASEMEGMQMLRNADGL